MYLYEYVYCVRLAGIARGARAAGGGLVEHASGAARAVLVLPRASGAQHAARTAHRVCERPGRALRRRAAARHVRRAAAAAARTLLAAVPRRPQRSRLARLPRVRRRLLKHSTGHCFVDAMAKAVSLFI